jgi:hypothetical protein
MTRFILRQLAVPHGFTVKDRQAGELPHHLTSWYSNPLSLGFEEDL